MPRFRTVDTFSRRPGPPPRRRDDHPSRYPNEVFVPAEGMDATGAPGTRRGMTTDGGLGGGEFLGDRREKDDWEQKIRMQQLMEKYNAAGSVAKSGAQARDTDGVEKLKLG